jgi:hypothetical protein
VHIVEKAEYYSAAFIAENTKTTAFSIDIPKGEPYNIGN